MEQIEEYTQEKRQLMGILQQVRKLSYTAVNLKDNDVSLSIYKIVAQICKRLLVNKQSIL